MTSHIIHSGNIMQKNNKQVNNVVVIKLDFHMNCIAWQPWQIQLQEKYTWIIIGVKDDPMTSVV